MIKILTNVLLLFVVFSACNGDTPLGVHAPTLELVSVSKTTMSQGLTDVGFVATLKFEDIDGDIPDGPESRNIVIIDNRDGTEDIVSFPLLPEVNGTQSGTLRLDILRTCCLNDTSNPCEPDPLTPTNEYTYDIYIKDAANHQSNRVTTPVITLECT